MNRDRFVEIVEAYGADPRRWPEAERPAAQAYAAAHPEAQALLDEARQLDAVLDVAREPAPGADLAAARILAAAPKAQKRGGMLRPALALAACAVAGVLIGVKAADFAPPAEAADAETVLDAAFGSALDGGEG